jgi:cytochrome b involved in lipid metabolism
MLRDSKVEQHQMTMAARDRYRARPHTVAELRALPDEKITARQVARHAADDDLWISIHGRVYDVTHLHPYHPGGSAVIKLSHGSEGGERSIVYDGVYHPAAAMDTLNETFSIGVLVTDEQAAALGLPDDDSGIVQRLDALYGAHDDANGVSAKPQTLPAIVTERPTPAAAPIAAVVRRAAGPVTIVVATEVKVFFAALLLSAAWLHLR